MAVSEHGRGSDQFSLRLPEGMRDKLKDAAAQNGRSMNAEIVQRLEESFGFLPSVKDIESFIQQDERYVSLVEPIRAELRKDQPDIRRVVDFLDFMGLDVVVHIQEWNRANERDPEANQ